jgi:anti-sigma B factor antagonist
LPAAPFHAKLLRHSQGVGLVDVAGEIDMHTTPELDEVLSAALRARPDRLIVDLTGVGFIDSTGLSVLVRNAKLALSHGASFEIVCADSELLQVFEITGLRDVLSFHPTRAEALST